MYNSPSFDLAMPGSGGSDYRIIRTTEREFRSIGHIQNFHHSEIKCTSLKHRCHYTIMTKLQGEENCDSQEITSLLLRS